jgi:hypothetical protein
MNTTLDTVLLFGFLTFMNLWGGAAIGAGLRGRAVLPLFWGLLVGCTPMYFGAERGVRLDSWAGLAWQIGCVLASAIAVAAGPVQWRAWLLQAGMTAVMIGSLLMAAGAVLGALLFLRGSEVLSLVLGGAGFLLGAMWFGSGLNRLRGRP